VFWWRFVFRVIIGAKIIYQSFLLRKPNRIACYYFAFSIKEIINTLVFIANQTIFISLIFAALLQAVYNLVFNTKNTQIINSRLISILSLK
jgi:hypothetical protein